jgi:N-acetylglucosaminyldiphosphoundecaprenol N-acetyl-beta-D-mannosaminyltransferase
VRVGRHSVLGVEVDAVDYEAAIDSVLHAAHVRQPFALSALAVHGVMTGVHDRAYRAQVNALDMVIPDGQPVRWALNVLHHTGLREWVSGPELVLRLLRRAALDGLPVYLYGSTAQIGEQLRQRLGQSVPALRIAGVEPSRFRLAAPGEARAIAARIRRSGARLVLFGLGCPRQERFVFGMRPLLDMPLLAVGAAFDYHAGRLRPAPDWMQRSGLAWLWRFAHEPTRLWRRYLLLNPEYLLRLGAQWLRWWRPVPVPPADGSSEPLPV